MLHLYKNYFVVGRAATAIYLILCNEKNKDVLVPANICYAAVYPIIYSDNNAVFCDVDKQSGNVTYNDFVKSITSKTKFAIIPHMFGNPNGEIKKISEYCKKNGVILIEDCASSMGAMIGDKPCGSFGDYTIYSTGYSKTVDLGNGGILTSDFPLCREKIIYEDLPEWKVEIWENNSYFSKKYRAFRNGQICEQDFYKFAHINHISNYIFKLPKAFEKTVLKCVNESLSEVVKARKEASELYDELLNYNGMCKSYSFENGAVPWRKNIYISSEYRNDVIRELLAQNIPVSDWYPVISKMFDDFKEYPNAKAIENTILNFPLLSSKEEICRICDAVNDITREAI